MTASDFAAGVDWTGIIPISIVQYLIPLLASVDPDSLTTRPLVYLYNEDPEYGDAAVVQGVCDLQQSLCVVISLVNQFLAHLVWELFSLVSSRRRRVHRLRRQPAAL